MFKVTDCPEIHSNGFHLCFDKTSGPMGYILPHWVDDERPLNTHLANHTHTRLVVVSLTHLADDTHTRLVVASLTYNKLTTHTPGQQHTRTR